MENAYKTIAALASAALAFGSVPAPAFAEPSEPPRALAAQDALPEGLTVGIASTAPYRHGGVQPTVTLYTSTGQVYALPANASTSVAYTYSKSDARPGELVTVGATVTVSGSVSGVIGPVSQQVKIERASILDTSMSLATLSYPYTGSAIEPALVFEDGDYRLVRGLDYDYEVASGELADVGDGSVVVRYWGLGTYGRDDQTWTTEITDLSVTPRTIVQADVALADGSVYAATGEPVHPHLVFTDNGTPLDLVEGRDYTVTYTPPDATSGNVVAQVEGIGSCAGTASLTFTVQEVAGSLKDATVAADDRAYTGRAIAADPVVKLNGAKLSEGLHYRVSHAHNTLPGEASVTVTAVEGSGITDFTSAGYRIFGDLSSAFASASVEQPTYQYTGSPITPSLAVTFDGQPLDRATYDVSYAGNVELGRAEARATAKEGGVYRNSCAAEFSVVVRDIAGSQTIAALAGQTSASDGTPAVASAQPDIVFSDALTGAPLRLVKGVDYAVSYTEPNAAGVREATVTTVGEGLSGTCTGTLSFSYTVSTSLADAEVTIEGGDVQAYTGSQVRPGVTVSLGGERLAEGTDYTVSYGANVEDKGSVTVVAKGGSGYSGSASREFVIAKGMPADDATVVAPRHDGDPETPAEPEVPGKLPTQAGDTARGEVKQDASGTTEVELTDKDGEPAQGWVTVDGQTYFAENGKAITGWYTDPITGNRYYFYTSDDPKPTGTMARDTWYRDANGNWYVFDEDGVLVAGWAIDPTDGNWYYLGAWPGASGGSAGEMVTGWVNDIATGAWYYFYRESDEGETGALARNGWLDVDGERYYCSWSGVILSGWNFVNDKWYYFSPKRDGSFGMLQRGWIDDGGGWYFGDLTTGAIQTGWLRWGGRYFYLNPRHDGFYGKMATGWRWVGDTWYYFAGDGAMLSDTLTPDGYYVDADGRYVER